MVLNTKSLESLDAQQLEQLKALTDPLRLKIFKTLREPGTVSEVAAVLGMDRTSLYHHLKVLLKTNLVTQINVRHIRNLEESVYQAVDCLDFTHQDCPEPGPREPYTKLIMGITMDTGEDCYRSLSCDSERRAAASRKILKIRKDKLSITPKRISELMREFMEKVKELEDEDGDVEYSVTVSHFEM